MRLGKIIPQGTDSFKANSWVKIYESTLETAQTSVTISGLNGNTDVMYKLIVRTINNYNGSNYIVMKPNNDITAANYGYQYLLGDNVTVSASRGTGLTGLYILGHSVLNDSSFGEIKIYVKSGYIRTLINGLGYGISGTTINRVYLFGQSWNNTADNITSLVFTDNDGNTNAFGVGSYFSLWKPLAKV